MFYRVFLKLLFLLLLSGFVIGQMFAKAIKPHETIVYRTVDGRKLSLHCFYPGGVKQGEGRSAVIHFLAVAGWVGIPGSSTSSANASPLSALWQFLLNIV